jgi:Mg2+-importing ATPase
MSAAQSVNTATHTAVAGGLTTAQARKLLDQVGPNDPADGKRTGPIAQFLATFRNPLVLILLAAAIISATLGEPLDAVIIIVIVLLSNTLNFLQSYRSQQAADRLRQSVAPTASVLRDGQWVELSRRDVVPGDVIRLVAGDLIPADAQLLEARDLHIQQAALTGESLPSEKTGPGDVETSPTDPDAPDRVFLGTSVVSGTATALITATGPRTAFGGIVVRLAARPPETEFQRGMRRFGLLIMETVFFLVLFVFLVGVAGHHDAFESMLFAVSLAVGLTPEFLPMITTVTLGQGAVHMARQNVIVKHLEAIQNFGSMDVLCSDKTGTLTSGEMRLDSRLDPNGRPSDRPLSLAYLNSSYETGIRSPLDTAILAVSGFDTDGWEKLDEMPFDFERRRLSVVVTRAGERLLITKGAPESVLAICTQVETGSPTGGMDGQVSPLNATSHAACDATYQRLGAQGFRVLAVAYASVPAQDAYHVADEHDLTFAGYLAFADPILPDAADALKALRADGVQVKIISGDSGPVCRHVVEQVGLNVQRIVLGADLEKMTDAALTRVVEQVDVFARVSPAQKNRIILALKAHGRVVGYLGDGINDAPSLHAADVGISVSNAVDVAKDAADFILLQPGLRVLHAGIIEGRKAFGNVMKYLLMGTSSNFGNMFSMAGAFVFLPFLPMLPTQILLNNFLYDLSQVTIPTDNVDATYIHKPHHWDISLIRNFMICIGPLSSIYDFLTFFVLLDIFHSSATLFHTGWFVESLATQTLVLFVIRTAGNPFKSRPSRPLTLTTLLIVAVGIALPFSPLAGPLGFVPLPPLFFLILALFTLTYLALVELVKRRLMRHLVV